MSGPAKYGLSSKLPWRAAKYQFFWDRHHPPLLSDGHSPKEIANIAGVSDDTVRSQIKSIFSKTGVRRAKRPGPSSSPCDVRFSSR
jgi:hypothetical protein